MSEKFDVAIIGGGASGLIAAYQLALAFGKTLNFLILDKNPETQIGLGLAYKDASPALLLNVPAERMGIDPRYPKDFLVWLEKQRPEALRLASFPFVPRSYYGEYLQQRFQECSSLASFTHRQEAVESCDYRRGMWMLHTQSKARYRAKNLIIATGYGPIKGIEAFASLSRSQLLDTHECLRLDEVRGHEDLLILGTGLSAIDAWHQLHARGHLGKVHFISRNGLLPEKFVPDASSSRLGKLSGLSPRQLLSLARTLYRALPDENARAGVFIQIREQAPAIWSTWSQKERSRFLNHLDPLWKIFRHRLPPSVSQELKAALAKQNVIIHRGKITGYQTDGLNIEVSFKTGYRKDSGGNLGKIEQLLVQRIFCAQGPTISALPTLTGSHPGRCWKIGPAHFRALGETSAIKEIREQALLIANEIRASQETSAGRTLFSHHPSRQGETYGEHLRGALAVSLRIAKIAAKLATHALFPFAYQDDASNDLRDLSFVLSQRRTRLRRPPAGPAAERTGQRKAS
jgi:uncharacterized NAD(P)/FAD-binding protein YdhS